jgi:hypothetical protein
LSPFFIHTYKVSIDRLEVWQANQSRLFGMISEIVSTHLEAFRGIVSYDFLSEKLEFDIVVRMLASQLMVTRFSHRYLSICLGFKSVILCIRVYVCVSLYISCIFGEMR